MAIFLLLLPETLNDTEVALAPFKGTLFRVVSVASRPKVTALMIPADAGWARQSKARAVVAVASGDVMFVHPFNKGPHTQAAMTKRQIQPPARSGRQENEGLRAVPQCGAMIGRRGCGLGDGSKK